MMKQLCLIVAFLCLAVGLDAATTTITGTIRGILGAGWQGTVSITASNSCSPSGGGIIALSRATVDMRASTTGTFQHSNGAAVTLEPTDVCSETGTHYDVRYRGLDGGGWEEEWSVTSSSPNAIEDIRTTSTSIAVTLGYTKITGCTPKGSLLVASGTSLACEAVGTNDYVLTADSAQANGVKWALSGVADAVLGKSTLTNVNYFPVVGSAGTLKEANGLYQLGTANITQQIVKAGSAQSTNFLQYFRDNADVILSGVDSAGGFNAFLSGVRKQALAGSNHALSSDSIIRFWNGVDLSGAGAYDLCMARAAAGVLQFSDDCSSTQYFRLDGPNRAMGTGANVTDAIWVYGTGATPTITAKKGDSSANIAVLGANFGADAAGSLYWSSRSTMRSGGDGYLDFYNNAGTGFTAIRLGGLTSSFPAIFRSGTTLQAKLADNSNFAPFQANSVGVRDASASQAVSFILYEQGAVKWRWLKETDNSMSFYDAVADQNIMTAATGEAPTFPQGLEIAAGGYTNFGATQGSGGYGFRDNAGTMEYKGSGGAWTAVGSGGSGGNSGTNYTESFTSQTSVTALGTEHNFGHKGLSAAVYDTSGNEVQWDTLFVHPTTYDVTVTFTTAQSGILVVMGGGPGGYWESFTAQTQVTMTNSEHGIGSANVGAPTCLDGSTPKKEVGYDRYTVHPSTYQVDIYFLASQTGICGIGGGGGGGGGGGAPGSDSIGTDELDDASDTPGSADYVRVDTVDQAGFEYRTPAEVLSDISAEPADAAIMHTDDAGEVAGLTEKVSPVAGDWVLVEDSAAANVKKKVQVGNLPTGSPGTDSVGTDEIDDGADSPSVGECVVVASGATSFEYIACPGGASTGASYVTTQAEAGLSNEFSLGTLADDAIVAVDVAGAVATPRAAASADVIKVFDAGACGAAEYLKGDGTCATPAGAGTSDYMADQTDPTVSRTDATHLEIFNGVSAANPSCFVFVGLTQCFTSSMTLTRSSGAASGTVYVEVDKDGTLYVLEDDANVYSCDAGCTIQTPASSFNAGRYPIGTWSLTTGSFDVAGFTDARGLGTTPLIAGTGMVVTAASGGYSVAVDTASVPIWVSAPATAASSCTPGEIAEDDSYFYVCISANTWKRVAIATW